MEAPLTPNCPIPFADYPHVLLAHGGGGRLTQQMLEQIFFPSFDNAALRQRHDGALLELRGQRLAFTTDSYVVRPLFFPGGDIGALAINGAVNDLVMCGARPLWLSAGFILEEGLPMETVWRVAQSMKRAAAQAGVEVVTGDTKVVDKGKGDGLFVTTAGVGALEHQEVIAPHRVVEGDVVLLSGDLGRHGMAIMSVREGLQFESQIESDCAPLVAPVLELIAAGVEVHCLRDLTRGGLASALNEIAAVSRLQVRVDEALIPVRDDVRAACEILGLEPLYVANEGRFVAFVAPRHADAALEILQRHDVSKGACQIGAVTTRAPGLVTIRSRIGSERILDLLSGEQLPRIC